MPPRLRQRIFGDHAERLRRPFVLRTAKSFRHFRGCIAAWVGPLNPSAASDWQRLGSVHADLHGLLLSPDFTAELKNGSYQPGSGGVWMLSDGGVYRSSDGGGFDPADNATTRQR